MIILLNYIIKAENSKHLYLFKNKQINQDTIIKFFVDLKVDNIFTELFRANDKNGKWLSLSIHKHLYNLLKKYSQKFSLPNYLLRDYQEVFMLYPYIIALEEKNNTL